VKEKGEGEEKTDFYKKNDHLYIFLNTKRPFAGRVLCGCLEIPAERGSSRKGSVLRPPPLVNTQPDMVRNPPYHDPYSRINVIK
jgi:hypothetical protein